MRRRHKRGKSLPWLLGSGLAFATLEVARRVYRHNQIFCPSRDPVKSWDPADYGIPPERVEKLWIDTPDGERLYAWYCRAQNPKASALWCHGNTGNLTISADVAPALLDAGINLLLFDYRGFGLSTGIASYNGVIADAVTAARFHDKIRPQHLPSIAYGFSLGGAIAAQVLRRHPFDALILQSTFTSLPRLARVLWPRFPMHLLTGDLFDTIGIVKNLKIPLLVIHGSADEVVPSSMAQELYDACPTPKAIHIVEGGLHKDLFVRDADGLIWATSQFVSTLKAAPRMALREESPHWADLTLRALRRAIRRLAA